MIGRKPFMFVLLGLVIMLAAAVFAPSALAVQTTHIMYAQENTVVYSYTPAHTGTYDMTLSWGSGSPVWPKSEVDGGIWGFMHDVQINPLPAAKTVINDPFFDQDDYTTTPDSFYSGTNPEVAQWVDTDAANHAVYFGVMPYAGDVSYTLVVKFTPTGGSQTTIFNTTGTATAADGTAFVPAFPNGTTVGTWHSSRQFWAGSAATSYADWNDYVEGRVPASSSGHAGPWIAWTQDSISYPPAAATTTQIDPNGTTSTSSSVGWDNEWYSVVPEIWPSYKVPNVLGTSPDPVNSAPADMQPDTIAATQAPLWYTYSYPDKNVSTLKPAYMWTTTTLASASKRSFASDTTTASSLSFKFYGPTVTWVYVKNKNAGIAKVTIDGAAPASNATVDQYAAAVQYGATTTWSGLGATAYHTITIVPNKTKNAASSGFFTYHDAFQAPTDPQCAALMGATAREENNYDGSTTYLWGVTTYAAASGGNFSSCKSNTGATAVTFAGTQITWKYIKGPKAGIQRVCIDGVAQPNVDQYSAAVATGSTTFTGLTGGGALHTILITGTGTKNAASTGLWIYSDAFTYGSTTVEN